MTAKITVFTSSEVEVATPDDIAALDARIAKLEAAQKAPQPAPAPITAPPPATTTTPPPTTTVPPPPPTSKPPSTVTAPPVVAPPPAVTPSPATGTLDVGPAFVPKVLPALLAAFILFGANASLAAPQANGCNTAFYLDPLCKGVGVGMKSSGQYPVYQDGSAYASVTTGDLPDPDPTDPLVKTTADWQAKWGNGNGGMVNFLNQRKGFANTARIFYLSQSGDNASAKVNDPTHPYSSMAPILTALVDGQGGAVVVRGGDWRGADISAQIDATTLTVANVTAGEGFIHPGDPVFGPGVAPGTKIVQQLTVAGNLGPNKNGTYEVSVSQTVKAGFLWAGFPLDFGACSFNAGNPCDSLSGTAAHPLYVMVYPGETVLADKPVSAPLTYKPAPNVGWYTIDGFKFVADNWGLGDGLSLVGTTNVTITNNEFVGWHQTFFGDHTDNAVVKNNVYHDMMYHAIYFGFTQTLAQLYPNQDFDFADNAATCKPGANSVVKPGETCASHNATITGNAMYGNGAGGYEPIHLNTYLDVAEVADNFISFSGGTGIGLQTGIYHAHIHDNVIFDNGRDAITLYLYSGGNCTLPATLRWTTIDHNILWTGNPTDHIRGTQPGGGIVQFDNTGCPGHWIKDTTIANNIIVTDDYAGSNWAGAFFRFQANSFPETDTIQNNIVWNSNAGVKPATDIAASVLAGASPTIPVGTYNLSQFQTLSPNFSGNIFADPKFKAADLAFWQTPGKFDFTLQPGSPVK